MVGGTPHNEYHKPGHNVSLWLHRLRIERQLHQWPDSVATAEASLLMGDVALTWFLTHCDRSTSWADFQAGMKHRFGDSRQTMMARLMQRKQQQNESEQSYADDMNMMFSHSVFPETLKRDLLLDNLKAGLREQVMSHIPRTAEQVIANATYLETKSASNGLKIGERQGRNKKEDTLEHFYRSLGNMTATFATCFKEQEQHTAQSMEAEYITADRPNQEQRDCRTPQPCWKCQRYGHRASDCRHPASSSEYAILHSQVHGMHSIHLDADDCTPSTPEALAYSQRLQASALQERQYRTASWPDKALQTASEGVAKCCTVIGGSDAAHTEAASSRIVLGDAEQSLPCARDSQDCKEAVPIILQAEKQKFCCRTVLKLGQHRSKHMLHLHQKLMCSPL